MSYPKSLKQRAKQLADDGLSAEAIADLFDKEVAKGKHDYQPTSRTIRNWLQQGEKPTNWIDEYRGRHGKLPPVPDFIVDAEGVYNYTRGEPISPEVGIRTPSGQFWNKLLPSQQREWRELVKWLGKDPEDLLAHMRIMLPKSPPGAERIRWAPFEQR